MASCLLVGCFRSFGRMAGLLGLFRRFLGVLNSFIFNYMNVSAFTSVLLSARTRLGRQVRSHLPGVTNSCASFFSWFARWKRNSICKAAHFQLLESLRTGVTANWDHRQLTIDTLMRQGLTLSLRLPRPNHVGQAILKLEVILVP